VKKAEVDAQVGLDCLEYFWSFFHGDGYGLSVEYLGNSSSVVASLMFAKTLDAGETVSLRALSNNNN